MKAAASGCVCGRAVFGSIIGALCDSLWIIQVRIITAAGFWGEPAAVIALSIEPIAQDWHYSASVDAEVLSERYPVKNGLRGTSRCPVNDEALRESSCSFI